MAPSEPIVTVRKAALPGAYILASEPPAKTHREIGPISDSEYPLRNSWLSRVYKLHRALEELIEAIVCEAIDYKPGKRLDNGNITLEWCVLWWNPAAWIAWSRTVIFRDRCGCAYYRKLF